MRPTVLPVLLLLASALLGGCGDQPVASGCTFSKASLTLSNPTNAVAVWDTTLGCIAAELFQDKAPITAGNFYNLTSSKFYDGARFHRVIDGFMIQDGDPNSKDPAKKSQWGTGGPGYSIPDEYRADLRHSAAGTLSMANSGANTGGSQYFITLVATSNLDAYDANGKLKNCTQRGVSCHAVFGKVVGGLDVVQKIGKVSTDANDRPLTDVVIKSLKILET